MTEDILLQAGWVQEEETQESTVGGEAPGLQGGGGPGVHGGLGEAVRVRGARGPKGTLRASLSSPQCSPRA